MAKGKYSRGRDVTGGDGTIDGDVSSDDDVVDLTETDSGTAADSGDTAETPKTVVAARPSMTRLYKADPKGGTKARSGGGRVTPSSKAAAKPQSKEDKRRARIEARQAARSAPRPTPATHADDGARLAPIPSRGFAAIVDIAIVAIVYFGISFLVGDIYGKTKDNQLKGAGGVIAAVAVFVFILIYAVPSVALFGQTLGHRILKLRVRVVGTDGAPGFATGLRRYFLLAALATVGQLGILAGILGGLSFYIFKDGRSVLDRMAKTEVIAYGPERAGSSKWKRGLGR